MLVSRRLETEPFRKEPLKRIAFKKEPFDRNPLEAIRKPLARPFLTLSKEQVLLESKSGPEQSEQGFGSHK